MIITPKHSVKKNVHWGDLIVFEFPNQLGDNPAVSGGAPLTIGWNHVAVNVVTIEYNEYMRFNTPRRKRKDLMLSSAQRDTVSDICRSIRRQNNRSCSPIVFSHIICVEVSTWFGLFPTRAC